jgi:hypothetical protein
MTPAKLDARCTGQDIMLALKLLKAIPGIPDYWYGYSQANGATHAPNCHAQESNVAWTRTGKFEERP